MLRTKRATMLRGAGQNPRAVITTDDVDSERDVIRQEGLRFRPRMRVLTGHDYGGLPVGVVEKIVQHPGRTEASWRWIENDPDAERVRNIYEQDGLDASVGLRVEESERNEHGGYNILKAEVIEFSLTPVPANAACVALMKELGQKQAHELSITLADDGPELFDVSEGELRAAVALVVGEQIQKVARDALRKEMRHQLMRLTGRVD